MRTAVRLALVAMAPLAAGLAGCAVEPFPPQVYDPAVSCADGKYALINQWGTSVWRADLLRDMERRGCFFPGDHIEGGYVGGAYRPVPHGRLVHRHAAPPPDVDVRVRVRVLRRPLS